MNLLGAVKFPPIENVIEKIIEVPKLVVEEEIVERY